MRIYILFLFLSVAYVSSAQRAVALQYRYFILTNISKKGPSRASSQLALGLRYQEAFNKNIGFYGELGTILISNTTTSAILRAENDRRFFTNRYQSNLIALDGGLYHTIKNPEKAGWIRVEAGMGVLYGSYAEQSSMRYEFAFGSFVENTDTYDFNPILQAMASAGLVFGGSLSAAFDFSFGFSYKSSLFRAHTAAPTTFTETPLDSFPSAIRSDILFDRNLVGARHRIGFIGLDVGLYYRL